jgi:ZIP family zinc transporter
MPDPASLPTPAEPAALAPPRRAQVRAMRRVLGLCIVAGGVAAGLDWVWREAIAGNPHVENALWGGLVAALATALGALAALLTGAGTSERSRDAMLGFGAGVMLAACSFSLIAPALQAAQAQGASRLGASTLVALALFAGAGLLLALERWVQAGLGRGQRAAEAQGRRLASTWLFVFAVTLHNLPEGLAIGVGFAGDDPQAGRALAAGIAIQDVPEGMVIAMALRSVGYGRALSILIGAASGLGEPVAAVLGALIVSASAALLPVGLAFAAGAMLFVIGHDVIPQSHQRGHARLATTGLVGGFALMMLLDTALS